MVGGSAPLRCVPGTVSPPPWWCPPAERKRRVSSAQWYMRTAGTAVRETPHEKNQRVLHKTELHVPRPGSRLLLCPLACVIVCSCASLPLAATLLLLVTLFLVYTTWNRVRVQPLTFSCRMCCDTIKSESLCTRGAPQSDVFFSPHPRRVPLRVTAPLCCIPPPQLAPKLILLREEQTEYALLLCMVWYNPGANRNAPGVDLLRWAGVSLARS